MNSIDPKCNELKVKWPLFQWRQRANNIFSGSMMNVSNIGWVKNIWIKIRNFPKILSRAKNSLPLIKLVFKPTWTKKASNWGIICPIKNLPKLIRNPIFSSTNFIFSDTIDSVKKVCEEDLKTAKSKINESAWCNLF